MARLTDAEVLTEAQRTYRERARQLDWLADVLVKSAKTDAERQEVRDAHRAAKLLRFVACSEEANRRPVGLP